MHNVTDVFQKYRMCLRQIWNSYVWIDPELRNWDAADRFAQVKPLMYKLLIEDRFSGSQSGFDLSFALVPCVPGPQNKKVAGNVIILKHDGAGVSHDGEIP